MNKGDVFVDKKREKPPLKCVAVCEDKYLLAMCDEVPILSYATMEAVNSMYVLRKSYIRVGVDIDKEDEFLERVDKVFAAETTQTPK